MMIKLPYNNYSAQVFEGHPFIVEAGVSLGGKDVKQVSTHYLYVYVPKT